MQTDRASTTAGLMAFLRAAHQYRPHDRRTISDPVAPALVTHRVRRWMMQSRLMHNVFDWMNPSLLDQTSIRDRFADEVAVHALADRGPSQVLLLGAGIDTMVSRLEQRLPQATFYEVDAPGTQRLKQELLRRRGLPWAADRCRFVPVDFERQSLGEELCAAGFSRELPTAVNWMGVIYYLTPEAVEGAFAGLRALLAPGSVIAFDYPTSDSSLTWKPTRRLLLMLGERLTYPLSSEAIVPLAERHGFAVQSDICSTEFITRFVSMPRRWRSQLRLASLVRVAD